MHCSDPERLLEIYYFRVVASDEFEIEHQIPGSQSHAPRHSITRSSVRENTAVFLRKLIMLQVYMNCISYGNMIDTKIWGRDRLRLFRRIGTFPWGCITRTTFQQTFNLATSLRLENPKEWHLLMSHSIWKWAKLTPHITRCICDAKAPSTTT